MHNFLNKIAENFANPSDTWLGKIVSFIMTRSRGIENPFMLGLLNLQPTDHVLEIGFGPGLMLVEVAKHAAHVAGIDTSPAMVQQASKRAAPFKVDLRLGEAAHLPYPDASFDKAFAIHVIYFWDNPVAVLQEIRRVLKPNGFFIALGEDKAQMSQDRVTQTGVFHLYTADEYQQLFLEAGFRHVEIIPSTKRPSFLAITGTA